jgi:hypothetical protein
VRLVSHFNPGFQISAAKNFAYKPPESPERVFFFRSNLAPLRPFGAAQDMLGGKNIRSEEAALLAFP